jgi:hypothetical protein
VKLNCFVVPFVFMSFSVCSGYRIDDDSEFAVEDSYEVREIDVEISGKSGERNLERLEYETKKFSNDAK